jgi:N6-adenosine-specific RNA methylase IME4
MEDGWVMDSGSHGDYVWSWDQVRQLKIDQITNPSTASFMFLWVGSSPLGKIEGLKCLEEWGFRRIEEIVWIMTNHQGQASIFS